MVREQDNAQLLRSMRRHNALHEVSNPVVRGIHGCSDPEHADCANQHIQDLAVALGQYMFLIRRIVGFLSIGLARFSDGKHPLICAELMKNIGEERGSRTNGESHRSIITRLLRMELKLQAIEDNAHKGTQAFLWQIEEALIERPIDVVAGILFALEASATPELKVVAELINMYSSAKFGTTPVHIRQLDSVKRAQAAAVKHSSTYNLDDFLVVHTADFEAGHRDRLWAALSEELASDLNGPSGFTEGFEFVLQLMDDWWKDITNR